jgi:hypothetical protein
VEVFFEHGKDPEMLGNFLVAERRTVPEGGLTSVQLVYLVSEVELAASIGIIIEIFVK